MGLKFAALLAAELSLTVEDLGEHEVRRTHSRLHERDAFGEEPLGLPEFSSSQSDAGSGQERGHSPEVAECVVRHDPQDACGRLLGLLETSSLQSCFRQIAKRLNKGLIECKRWSWSWSCPASADSRGLSSGSQDHLPPFVLHRREIVNP